MLGSALIIWELYAMFYPEMMTLDAFDLLLDRGGALFQSFFNPEGGFRKKDFNKVNRDIFTKKGKDRKPDLSKFPPEIHIYYHYSLLNRFFAVQHN